MLDILYFCAIGFLSFCLLWYGFLAYASLGRAHSRETRTVTILRWSFETGLSNVQIVVGLPLVVCFGLIDVFCNIVPLSIIIGQPPEWGEWTVTMRCRRLVRGPDGWSKTVAMWLAIHFTDDFEPNHILPKQDIEPAK